MNFSYDTQIASCQKVVAELLEGVAPPSLDPSRPILFSGIGTSLHAARIAAEWVTRLSHGEMRPIPIDAHDLGTTAPIRAGATGGRPDAGGGRRSCRVVRCGSRFSGEAEHEAAGLGESRRRWSNGWKRDGRARPVA